MINLNNLRIFGIVMLVTSLGIVTYGTQTVSSSVCPPECEIDIDADEFERVGNTTNMTIGNMNETES